MMMEVFSELYLVILIVIIIIIIVIIINSNNNEDILTGCLRHTVIFIGVLYMFLCFK